MRYTNPLINQCSSQFAPSFMHAYVLVLRRTLGLSCARGVTTPVHPISFFFGAEFQVLPNYSLPASLQSELVLNLGKYCIHEWFVYFMKMRINILNYFFDDAIFMPLDHQMLKEDLL